MEAVERHRAAADHADVGGAAGCLEPRFAVGDVLVVCVSVREAVAVSDRVSTALKDSVAVTLAEGVDCILMNDTDAVRETSGVKVGSAVVDKVYWLESDGTLL